MGSGAGPRPGAFVALAAVLGRLRTVTPTEERAVREAASRVRAFERWRRSRSGHGFTRSADEVLSDALPETGDLWAWAELARAALACAEGREPDAEPEPPDPRAASRESHGVPIYATRAGGIVRPV